MLFENYGIDDQLDEDSAKRVLFTNRASLIVFCLIQIYCLLYLFIGSANLLIVSESLGLGFLLILLLNYHKYYTSAKIAAVMLSNFTIVTITYLFSLEGGVQFYFIPAALASQFLFKPNNKLAIFLTAMVPLILYFLCVLYIPEELSDNFNIQPLLLKIVSNTSFSLSLILSALFAYFYAYQNNVVEKELLHAKKEAESANLAKSKFISIMSHEMRTPINSIIGFSDLLQQTRLEQNQVQQIENVKTASQNLLHVINDILDYSEMESGKINQFNEAFSLEKLIRELQENLKPLANKKNLALEFEINGDLQAYYHSDKRIIRTILSNLLQNAIKFTDSGTVTIIVRAQEILENNQKISISIKDTGIGFNTAFTENIFNRFTQLSDDFNRKYGGTGLGLALVKELAISINGEIEVQSTLGKGSTFTVHLDLQINRETIEQKAEISYDQQDLLAGYKVLLAEDDEFTAFLTQKMLKEWGMEVSLVKDGLDAINAGKAEIFDIVLMDIQMPKYDGIEATLSIKRDSLNMTTPIIGCTANVDSETRLKGTKAGMVEFIYKPFIKEDMYRILVKHAILQKV